MEDIKNALQSAARIVDRYGDAYWPLFERLERELQERHGRTARLNRYLPSTEKASPVQRETSHPAQDARSS